MPLATTGRLGQRLSRLGRIRLGWPDLGAAVVPPGSDSGTGSEVALVELPVLETGTGSDAARVFLTVADTGTGVEQADPPTVVPGDVGTGADTARVELSVADTGTGAEEVFWEIVVGDAGVASDALTALDRNTGDAGHGFDGIPATYDLVDAGAGTDAYQLTIQGSDGGFGSDGNPLFYVEDVGLGFDRRVKQVLLMDPLLEDSGTAVYEYATVNNFDDYGIGVDTAHVEVHLGAPGPGEPGYGDPQGPGQPGGVGHPLSDRGIGTDRARLIRVTGPGGGPGDGEVRVSQLVVEFPLEATLPITFEPPPWWWWYPWIPPPDTDETPPTGGHPGDPGYGPPTSPPAGRPGYGAMGNQARATQLTIEIAVATGGGEGQVPYGTLVGL